jgi:hypothetical protein
MCTEVPDSECPICFNERSERLSVTPCCRQTIHKSCYRECIHRFHECPMCLERYVIIDIPVKDNSNRCTLIGSIAALIVFTGGMIYMGIKYEY